MAKRKRILVPQAREALDSLKVNVMSQHGYAVDHQDPDRVKYEVAEELGISLKKGDNGKLTSKEAGKIGGPIGGSMVKEMIRLAQEQLAEEKLQEHLKENK